MENLNPKNSKVPTLIIVYKIYICIGIQIKKNYKINTNVIIWTDIWIVLETENIGFILKMYI